MADATYQPKVYKKQGGDELVVAASGAINIESSGALNFESGSAFTVESGGDIAVESGGTQTIESGGDIAVESGGIVDMQTGAVVKDTTAGAITDRHTFVDTVDWTGTASTAGGHGNWTAPASSDILITGFYLKIGTISATANCKLDVGTATATITTQSTDLFNSKVVTGAVTGVYYTSTGAPTAIKLKAGKFITATSTGTKATALVTKAYIRYVVV